MFDSSLCVPKETCNDFGVDRRSLICVIGLCLSAATRAQRVRSQGYKDQIIAADNRCMVSFRRRRVPQVISYFNKFLFPPNREMMIICGKVRLNHSVQDSERRWHRRWSFIEKGSFSMEYQKINLVLGFLSVFTRSVSFGLKALNDDVSDIKH